ncbi:MAG: T9SS type A sorting domain-containing protein [Bacteroidales bacterium]|nr:T9SS type A sorting domain-containing protein [Bacteroidales bacterium]
MKKSLILFLLGFTLVAHAQDTLKIMHYNLLNYGNYTSYCTSGNNNHETKDAWINTIISHELPDIFTVNEISNYDFYQNRILNSVLNSNGRTYYRKGNISNIAGSDIVNMLYYNSDKLVLKSYEVVQFSVRDIDLFTLYCKSPALEQGDTVYLHCLVAHLKAGSGDSDAEQRAEMTSNAIAYLKNHNQAGNFLIMGDFNTYTSSEACYQNLINLSAGDFRFFDPVNKPGDWNNNSSFASWHTQSVTNYSNGCQSTGGMDDRFDHIMATTQLINGSLGLKYIQDSYHAVGQDGRHYNKSITDSPANTTVPANVLTALFSNSDHLPVRLNLSITTGGPGGITEQSTFRNTGIYLVDQDQARLFITAEIAETVTISVFSITGQLIQSENVQLNRGRNEIKLDISGLTNGVYLVRLSDLQGRMASIKLVK